MADRQNVSRECVTVAQWEETLQASAREGGSLVAEVFSTKWGSCKAIAPTLRRLLLEADEAARLRFCAVDATPILQELEQHDRAGALSPGSGEGPRRRRDFEAPRDTTPDVWRPILARQHSRSKPLFLFYHAGRLVKEVQGVDTPLICSTVKDMTTIKTPADKFLTNRHLLDVWGEYFDPRDSVVGIEAFLQALIPLCKLTVPLEDSEVAALRRALCSAEGGRSVSAERLQAWAGDRTLLQAFTATLPHYEERATNIRLDEERQAEALFQIPQEPSFTTGRRPSMTEARRLSVANEARGPEARRQSATFLISESPVEIVKTGP